MEYLNTPHKFLLLYCFLALLLVSLVALFIVVYQESHTRKVINELIATQQNHWLTAVPSGSQVVFTGIAPQQFDYLHFIASARQVINPQQIVDQIEVKHDSYTQSQDYNLEFLLENQGVLIFGQFPTEEIHANFVANLKSRKLGLTLLDYTQSKEIELEPASIVAIEFVPEIFSLLDSGVISVAGNTIAISSYFDTQSQATSAINTINNIKPPEVELNLDITAPLPRINPYRFQISFASNGHDLTACYTETPEQLEQLNSKLAEQLNKDDVNCLLALGQPTENWVQTLTNLVEVLVAKDGISLTVSDTSVLITTPMNFSDTQIIEITQSAQNAVSEEFTLQVIAADSNQEFEQLYDLRVLKGVEGLISINGTASDALSREMIISMVDSELLPQQIGNFLTVDTNAPPINFNLLVAGMQALDLLYEGEVLIHTNSLFINGTSASQESLDQIIAELNSKLGRDNYSINVVVDTSIFAVNLPTIEECLDGLNQVLDNQKITFDSGSVAINESTESIILAIVPTLKDCAHFKWEIGGHTDSSGNSNRNLQLSQDRANAVLFAISLAGVPIDNFVAVGYGELYPIVSNITKEGRAQNRRIVIEPMINNDKN